MRHTCIGAPGLERFAGLHLDCARAWTIASLLGLLVSAEAAASSDIERDSLIPRERISFPSGSAPFPEGIGRDSSLVAAPAIGSPNLYSEAYWSALADLDLETSHREARSTGEEEFARGMELLTSGEHEMAETAFAALSTRVGDMNIALAAQMMLARTLLYEHKWAELRDLPNNPALGPVDQQNTLGLERWGQAFANIEPQSMTVPSKPASVPMRITAAGTPSIRVRINGKEYEFWLDTGSTMTVLSSDVAADTRVPIISSDILMVRTFAGKAEVRPGLVRRMQVGPIVITNAPVIVVDASMMRLKISQDGGPGVDYHVDGIIGWDFIRQFNVVLNYQSGRVTIAKPEQLGLAGTNARNLVWAGEPLVEVRTKQGVMLHFSLDTGAQSTFVNAAVLDKVGISTRLAGGRTFGIARTGSSTNRVIPSLLATVGGKPVRLDSVIVYGPSYPGLIACDGILGSDIAQFGVIRIDATNGVFTVGA